VRREVAGGVEPVRGGAARSHDPDPRVVIRSERPAYIDDGRWIGDLAKGRGIAGVGERLEADTLLRGPQSLEAREGPQTRDPPAQGRASIKGDLVVRRRGRKRGCGRAE